MEDNDAAEHTALRAAVSALSEVKQQLVGKELARRANRLEAIRRVPRTAGMNRFPASTAQERLFYLHELAPFSGAYMLPLAVRLHGDLNEGAVAAALTTLVTRHEILRTSFEFDSKHGLRQVVTPPGVNPIRLRAESVKAIDVPHQIRQLVREPVDFTTPPLFRARLWQVHDSKTAPEWILALCLHHIIADGWSLGILVEEFAEEYNARVDGRPSNLADCPLQFADFATWQADRLSGPNIDDHLHYWQDALEGNTDLVLSGDRRQRSDQSFQGESVRCLLEPGLVTELGRIGQLDEGTLYMVLLAGFAMVLHEWSDHDSSRDDLVIGAPVAGRSRPELEHVVGCFVNLLPLRIELRGAVTFRDLLHRTRDSCIEGYAHQDVPLELITQQIGGRRRGGRSALFKVMLSLRNVPLGPMLLRDLQVEFLDLPREDADFDLALALAPTDDGGLGGWLIYSQDLFDPQTADQILTDIKRTLAAVTANPDVSLNQLADQLSLGPARRVPTAPATPDESGAIDPLLPLGKRRPTVDNLHQVLAMIWSETLGVEHVDPYDDFFDLGGHSLLATLVVSEIRELFRIELPLHFFIDVPTVATLADLIRARGAEQNVDVDRVAALVLGLRQESTSD